MEEPRRNYGSLLHQIAADHGCTELAAFDIADVSHEIRPLYHVTGGDEADQPGRKDAAIEAFKGIIVRHCLPTGGDAAVRVEPSAGEPPQFCLVTLARRGGKVVGAAAFVRRFPDEDAADAALEQIRHHAARFRNGPPGQGAE